MSKFILKNKLVKKKKEGEKEEDEKGEGEKLEADKLSLIDVTASQYHLSVKKCSLELVH